MDPARPTDPDPADPFFPERPDHAVLEKIEIATEGEDCDECVRKLRSVLAMKEGEQRAERQSTETAAVPGAAASAARLAAQPPPATA